MSCLVETAYATSYIRHPTSAQSIEVEPSVNLECMISTGRIKLNYVPWHSTLLWPTHVLLWLKPQILTSQTHNIHTLCTFSSHSFPLLSSRSHPSLFSMSGKGKKRRGTENDQENRPKKISLLDYKIKKKGKNSRKPKITSSIDLTVEYYHKQNSI